MGEKEGQTAKESKVASGESGESGTFATAIGMNGIVEPPAARFATEYFFSKSVMLV